MTLNILNEFRGLLDKATWMDDMSKRFAHEKVNSMQSKIGYPDYILDDKFMDNYHREVSLERNLLLLNL